MTGNKYIQIIVLNKAELLNYWHSMRIYKVCTFRIWKRVKTDIRESRVLGLNKVTIYHQLYNYHSSLIIKLILAVVYSVQHTCCVTTEIKCFQILRFKALHIISLRYKQSSHLLLKIMWLKLGNVQNPPDSYDKIFTSSLNVWVFFTWH